MFLPISAIQHYAYCPRQFALIHVEQAWEENRFTAEGKILHERVDSGEKEKRGKCKYERSVSAISYTYEIQGKLDLLEIESGNPPKYFPVEYKRGKSKTQDWDRVQLCAQALCIEEMKDTKIEEGGLWYWETRQRERVLMTKTLRQSTIKMIELAKELLEQGRTPPPIQEKRKCRACSLKNICRPDVFLEDHSGEYVKALLEE